ncbi:MAG: GrdX family protein [Ezakiella sp.]|nr:GrdX family protein [Ezakiella sp.]MDY3923327.1 GrdX family protein [Ezakiella sp.]
MKTLVTNNKYVRDRFKDKFEIVFIEDEKSYMSVLHKVRDLVHGGYKLLTHPLSGSVKPNETPYKSVMLEKIEDGSMDIDGTLLIESAIDTMNKFQNNERTPNWTEKVLDDFRVIDLDIMVCTIERLGHF